MEVKERIIVTTQMVEDFARISGDTNPIHLNEEAAANSIFGKRIAHGILLAGFFSKLIAMKYPGPGSIYLQQNLEFLAPCFIGDEIEVELKLEERIKHVFVLATTIYSSQGKVLVKGTAKVLNKAIPI